jgi:O-antigen ligase
LKLARTDLVKITAFLSRSTDLIAAFLLAAAFATIQALIGGTRLLFSMPAYGLLSLIGLLALFSLGRAKPEPNRFCLVSTVLFFGYILARALFSPVDYLTRPDIYSVLGGLLVYFFVACLFTEAKRRMRLLAFLLALAIVHVSIGAIQFRDGHNFMLIPFLQRYDYGRRASGFYVCPNHLAGLLEVLGVFGLSIAFWSRWPLWAKLLAGYAVCVCYLGVALTGSRGGYLSTIASLAPFAVLSLTLLRKSSTGLFWKVGGPSLIVAAVIGLTAVFLLQESSYLGDRAQRVVDPGNVRIDMWQAAVQQWKLQPAFGTGSGTYLYYGRQFRSERVQEDPVYVHNDYLHLLAEYGVVGFAFFLVFLGSHLWSGWKNFRRLGLKRVGISSRLLSNAMALQLGAIAAVSAYLVHSFLDFNLHIPANVLLLAFVFGILANAGAQLTPDPVPLNRSAIAWRLFLPAIGLVVAMQCVRLLPGEYFTERSRTSLRDDDLPSSVLFAERALAFEHNNPNIYAYLGNARVEQAEDTSDPQTRASFYLAAIEALTKQRALVPQDKVPAVDLGFAYDGLGRFPEAEWMFEQALQLDPKSTSTRGYYQAHLTSWRAGKTASGSGSP